MDKQGFSTADSFFYGLLKEYARENRNHQTEAEQQLWFRLSANKLGMHFRRQHIIGCYIADFVCLKKKLIIEVDGGYHSQDTQLIKDYLRTADLNKMGFEVMRFKNEEMWANMSEVLDSIFDYIATH